MTSTAPAPAPTQTSTRRPRRELPTWASPVLLWIAGVVLLLLVPLVVTDMYQRLLLVTTVTYALLAVSWNLTLGISGIFNFAHVAMFGIGAYTSAILVVRYEWDPWLTMPVAGVVAALASVVAFIPVIRLRGIYVALATFIFSQLCIYLVLGQSDFTGGSSGMVGIPDLYAGDTSLLADARWGYAYLGIGLLIVAVTAALLLHRSTFGRTLLAIKDNEPLAASRGVPVFRLHLTVFMVGSFMAGVTGSYYAFTNNVVSTDIFSFSYATLLLGMIFLGGSRSIVGPLLGAVVITVGADQLRDQGPVRFIVVGVIIILVLRFFPHGIAGGLASLRDLVTRRLRGSSSDTASNSERNAP